MDFFKSIFDSVSDFFSAKSRYDLSDFQKKKLLHEYHMFYGRCRMVVGSFFRFAIYFCENEMK